MKATRRNISGLVSIGAALCGLLRLLAGATRFRRAMVAAASLFLSVPMGKAEAADRPNFIILFTDDLGYRDLGCFGSPDIKTPCIDRMAKEGLRLTSFYAQSVCGPSRAALLTGCYPARAGFPAQTAEDGIKGLRLWQLAGEEVTLAELLQKSGYATACIGKWDISGRAVRAGQMPNDQGFDTYFGSIGANDSGKVGLWKNREFIGIETNMGSLTGLYTDKAVEFIQQNREHPFFLYLAHTMPHVRIDASAPFKGKSAGGLYGDVIEELDSSTGRILDTLKEMGLDRNTYVLFTSDNGPWLSAKKNGGSALPLRDGKGSFWEGGSRVPAVLWGPGRVPGGNSSDAIVATLDVLPTVCVLAGARLPEGLNIDGANQSALFLGKTESGARQTFYYFSHVINNEVCNVLCAVRSGDWKLVLPNREGAQYTVYKSSGPKPLLYNLKNDIGETTDLSGDHPEKLAELLKLAEQAGRELGDNEQFGTGTRRHPSVPATVNWNGEPYPNPQEGQKKP